MRSALTKVEGVNNVKVAMPDKAEIKGSASAEQLIAAIEKAGYSAKVR